MRVKNLIYPLLGVWAFVSCERNETIGSSVKDRVAVEDVQSRRPKYIFYASWSEFGRTSRSCKGFGLCEFYSCWFCDGNRDDRKYSARVEVDKETNVGYMFIELDLNDEIQKNAFLNKSSFFIDEDLISENVILKSGEYMYDKSIGENGGYKIDVFVK